MSARRRLPASPADAIRRALPYSASDGLSVVSVAAAIVAAIIALALLPGMAVDSPVGAFITMVGGSLAARFVATHLESRVLARAARGASAVDSPNMTSIRTGVTGRPTRKSTADTPADDITAPDRHLVRERESA